jgi:hypothetical protein
MLVESALSRLYDIPQNSKDVKRLTGVNPKSVCCESAPMRAIPAESTEGETSEPHTRGHRPIWPGVSRSTVSRVINNQPSVRHRSVRERVEEVIRRTGYTPNVAARSLVSGRSGVIGLVIPSRLHSLFAKTPTSRRADPGHQCTASNQSGITLSALPLPERRRGEPRCTRGWSRPGSSTGSSSRQPEWPIPCSPG